MPEPKVPTTSAGEPTEPASNAEGQSGAEGATEDYAGYANLDEMRAAIYTGRKEGKRLSAAAIELAAENARLKQPQKTDRKSAMDEINDLGLPAETLREAIRAEAREVVAAELAPAAKTQAAISNLRATHPTFAKFEPEFNKWLSANPDVATEFNQDVTVNPNSAERLIRGAFAEYELTRRAPTGGPEPKKVGADAKIPASRGAGGSIRKESADSPGREEVREMIKDARRTGSPIDLMRSMLGGKSIHRDIEALKE